MKGIGPRLAEILAAKGIETVDDLLHYLPFRYEDRLNPRSVAELRAGEMATVIAEVRNSGLFRTRRMPIFQLTVGQGRSRLKCLWFNATYLQGRFQPGQMLALYGKVEADRDGQLQIMQPQFEILGDINEEGGASEAEKKAAASLEMGRIVPIYESAGQGKLTPRWFRRIIRSALENLSPELPDPIPAAVRAHLESDFAARSFVAGALAGGGRELCRSAIVANAGAHPDDFRRAVLYRAGAGVAAPRAEGANRELRSRSTMECGRRSRRFCRFIRRRRRSGY